MAWTFNPFTGSFDQKGSGGGGSVLEGEVATFADLPQTTGTPPVGSSYLVRESTGVWLVNRRQAGIYIRTNNTGVRADDWSYGGDFPVQSVNGEIGTVILDGSEIDSSTNDARAAFTMSAFDDGDGIYYPLPDLFINTKPVYSTTSGYSVFFENARWHITDGSPITANIIESSDNDNAAWPWLSAWSGSVLKAKLADVVGRARDTFLFVGDNLKVGTSSGLPLKTGSGGEVQAGAFGTGAGQFSEGNHTHGNLTNDGKIGTTANLPLKTGTNGVIEAGSFGTAAGSFCEGNDARLSDDRDPNLHAASHLPDGADEIFDQSLNTTDDVTFNTIDAFEWRYSTVSAINVEERNLRDQSANVRLNWGNNASGIEVAGPITIVGDSAATDKATTLSDLGAAASGSITTSGLTQATARILGRTTASTGAIEEITIGSGLSLSAGELSSTVSAGIPATIVDAKGDLIVASAADTVARLPVGGTNGHALVVDSAETLGVKWAAVSSANMTGATSTTAGSAGLVPQPAAGDEEKALLGSGQFHFPLLPVIKTQTTRGAAINRWIVPPFTQDGSAGTANGANNEFFGGHVYIPYTGSFYYATVPAALYTTNTKTCWGLYNLASDGLPGTLAYDLGELDVGAGNGVICESANSVSLNKGWYCCVSRHNGSFNLYSPQAHAWFNYILGFAGTGAINSTNAVGKRRFYRSLTYSTSLSSDLTSQSYTEDGNQSPVLFFRRA
jgi:hypothetical protein